MISIRTHLLSTLLPAFVGISSIAGFGIYYSTQAELEAQLDTQLSGHAIDLRFMAPNINRDGTFGKGRQNIRDNQRNRLKPVRGGVDTEQLQDTLFTNLPFSVYCEIWVGNRQVNLKTDNLEGGEITRPDAFPDDPVFYNAALENGKALRAWAAKIPVMRDKQQTQKVIVAISRNEVDETLEKLAHNLIGGGISICLLLSALLIFSLRSSLRPLRTLGEKAATMDAESLNERFSEKSAPSDIRPIVERLNILMGRLEESFARERRFSGDLAHELRTPLAAIRTTAEVAIKWPEQASADDFEEIHRMAAGLQQTLDSLLLLARMESSTAEKNIETVKPALIAEESLALLTARAAERGVNVEPSLDAAFEVQTDPRMLRIIMSNLTGNAIEYAPEGSTISFSTGRNEILFECTNEAPDLAPEDVAHLFERMWRKDAARTESGHAGLGLSIAKACADALNLTLTAELDHQGLLTISLQA